MALDIDTGVQCGIGLKNELILCTQRSPSLLSLSWNGEVNLAGTVSLLDLDFYEDGGDGLAQIVANASMDLFAWVTVTGNAYLAQRGKGVRNTPGSKGVMSTWSGLRFYGGEENDARSTYVAINSLFHLVAVGTTTGEVHVFSLTEDRSELRFSHKCTVESAGGGYGSVQLGAVSALHWSRDGYALAVGWIIGGLSVWSTFGHLLMCTVSEDVLAQQVEDSSDASMEQYFSGVRDLFWGIGSYELHVLPVEIFSHDPITEISVLQFAKSALACSNIQDNSRCIILVQDDKLLLYEGNYWDFDVMNLDMPQWDTIQIPTMYITQNWPIKHTSINSTGHYVAIAGTKGLAHYSAVSNRWKLFGNEQQEQSFTVTGGMLWYRDILIVACQDLDTQNHELRFFSRETNLSSTLALHTERLPRCIVAMNCLDANLLIYAADNVMRFYSITTESERVRLALQQQISLEGVIMNPSSVQSISWYSPAGEGTVEDIIHAPVVILSCGELSILRELWDGGWEMIGLSDKIEFFWVSRHQDRVGDLVNSLWAYDASGFKIWVNLNLTSDETSALVPKENLTESLQLHVDFYPLTIMMHRGIIAGVNQRMTVRTAMNCTLYRLDLRTHLFLHTMIRYMLSQGSEKEAITFADYYRHLAYFDHALEVLLHQVLEIEAETYAGFSPDAILPRVIRFLEHFPDYLDIIVQCARKTEVALWEYFFSIAGDPKELFKKSLENGFLKTATSYLIIIQTLEPATVSGKLAVDLLERAFELEDFETGKELVRFLTSIDGAEGEIYRDIIRSNSNFAAFDNSQSKTTDQTQKSNATDEARMSDSFYLEILISKHARQLLRKYRLRAFGRFAVALDFSMEVWLEKERNRAALIDDMPMAFASIHEQFQWPWPNDMKQIQAIVKASSDPQTTIRRKTYAYADGTFARALDGGATEAGRLQSRDDSDPALSASTQMLRRRAKTTFSPTKSGMSGIHPGGLSKPEVSEIWVLLQATLKSGCRQWAILLASMLMDLNILRDLLKDEEGRTLLGTWRALMLGTNCRGYRQLLKAMEDNVGEEETESQAVTD
ncbi:uncharacterized protein SPPG_09360 [Spizellomyces punctatus DAOM BR117]|uniref:RIC1 C-terminal alpha solenoid region domain-containing protein n=1 Tax=Spizellomyces punctatus (strain DAOM BR117) TaxID=645134 RepID=A0A0L0HCF7_SPIPD|nr:uncharacterized protein SPPG_09360 [Spizellomyces punctatus DAOM BR117]KNC98616.1 hypothetical protein SPPG_09360 [Spizellomyces punctatus DAOM BR117]|eukprot:XP_016606656.1 hypothetical protein SPPG_09360 [Spizellomyces punctatus DAOM BR117]